MNDISQQDLYDELTRKTARTLLEDNRAHTPDKKIIFDEGLTFFIESVEEIHEKGRDYVYPFHGFYVGIRMETMVPTYKTTLSFDIVDYRKKVTTRTIALREMMHGLRRGLTYPPYKLGRDRDGYTLKRAF